MLYVSRGPGRPVGFQRNNPEDWFRRTEAHGRPGRRHHTGFCRAQEAKRTQAERALTPRLEGRALLGLVRARIRGRFLVGQPPRAPPACAPVPQGGGKGPWPHEPHIPGDMDPQKPSGLSMCAASRRQSRDSGKGFLTGPLISSVGMCRCGQSGHRVQGPSQGFWVSLRLCPSPEWTALGHGAGLPVARDPGSCLRPHVLGPVRDARGRSCLIS